MMPLPTQKRRGHAHLEQQIGVVDAQPAKMAQETLPGADVPQRQARAVAGFHLRGHSDANILALHHHGVVERPPIAAGRCIGRRQGGREQHEQQQQRSGAIHGDWRRRPLRLRRDGRHEPPSPAHRCRAPRPWASDTRSRVRGLSGWMNSVDFQTWEAFTF